MEEHPVLVFSWTRGYPYESSLRQPILDAGQAFLTSPENRLRARLGEIAQSGPSELAAQAATLLAIADGAAANLVPNPGFEAEKPLEGWWAGTHFGTGNVKVTEDNPHQGGNAVVVRSTWDGYGGVFRKAVPVEPGRSYLFVLRARWEGEEAAGTVCQMLTQFFDAEGKLLPKSSTSHKFWPDNWWGAYLLQTPVAPANASKLNARVDAMAQPKTGHAAYFDDLRVYALGR